MIGKSGKAKTMKTHKMHQLATFIALGALALSQSTIAQTAQPELEQQALVDLPNNISGVENVRSRMNKFIDDQGLREIKDGQKDERGRTVLIDFAFATISASPKDLNFVAARVNAFNKALIAAKGQCAEFQKQIISTEAVLQTGLPAAQRAQADAERMKREGLAQEGVIKVAQALNTDIKSRSNAPQIIQTAALYGEKILTDKMTAEIRKKGLDPAQPVEQQVAKTIAESQSFKNAVSTVAAARCTGIKVLASFEQNPSAGQGEVGIITVWSEKLHAVADAIVTNQWNLVPTADPGMPLTKHIPDRRTLLTTYGVQLVRDQDGKYVLLAFSQAQPRTKNVQSINSAYEQAKTRGFGLIRSFMGEAVETNRDLLDDDVSTVFTDESTRYEEGSEFNQKVSVVGKSLPISGLKVVHEWETLHPANNAPVVGVVVQWTVASAQIAGHLSTLNQASGRKAANAPSTSANLNSGSVDQPRKSEPYSGQGRMSRDF